MREKCGDREVFDALIRSKLWRTSVSLAIAVEAAVASGLT